MSSTAQYRFDGENATRNLPPDTTGFREITDPEYVLRKGDLFVCRGSGAPVFWVYGIAGDRLENHLDMYRLFVHASAPAAPIPEVYEFDDVDPYKHLPPDTTGYHEFTRPSEKLRRDDLLLDSETGRPTRWAGGLAGSELGELRKFGLRFRLFRWCQFDGENPTANLPPDTTGFRRVLDSGYILQRGDLVTKIDVPHQWVRQWADRTLGWLWNTWGVDLDVWVRDEAAPAPAPASDGPPGEDGPWAKGWPERSGQALEKRALDETPEMDDVHVVPPNYAEELVGAVHATHALSATFEVEMGGHRYVVAVLRDDIYTASFARRSEEDKR